MRHQLAIYGPAAVLVIAAFVVAFQFIKPAPPDSVVESRDLRFIDGPDGLVHVRDVSSNAVVTSLAPGTENFIRGVLRGMARERRSRSLDTQTPFRIARHADGRVEHAVTV